MPAYSTKNDPIIQRYVELTLTNPALAQRINARVDELFSVDAMPEDTVYARGTRNVVTPEGGGPDSSYREIRRATALRQAMEELAPETAAPQLGVEQPVTAADSLSAAAAPPAPEQADAPPEDFLSRLAALDLSQVAPTPSQERSETAERANKRSAPAGQDSSALRAAGVLPADIAPAPAPAPEESAALSLQQLDQLRNMKLPSIDVTKPQAQGMEPGTGVVAAEEQGYWDKFASGFSTGMASFDIEQELGSLALTPTISAEEVEKREQALFDRMDKLGEGQPQDEDWISHNVRGLGSLIGGQVGPAKEGLTAATIAATGSALISLATGPYAPLVVKGSALMGLGHGTSLAWARQGTGSSYMAQRRRGVDVKTARAIAAGTGVAYAAVEKLQAGRVAKALPGGEKLQKAISNTVADKTAEVAIRVIGKAAKTAGGRFAVDLTAEQAQEIMQEGILLASQDIGVILDQGLDSPNRVQYEEAEKAVGEVLSLTGAMGGLLLMPRAVKSATRLGQKGLDRGRETKHLKAVAESITEEGWDKLNIDSDLSIGNKVRALRKNPEWQETLLGDTGAVITDEEIQQLRHDLQNRRDPKTGKNLTE